MDKFNADKFIEMMRLLGQSGRSAFEELDSKLPSAEIDIQEALGWLDELFRNHAD